MKNINIEQIKNGTYVVKADTERFGIQEIMFEGLNEQECINYIEKEGYKYKNQFVMDGKMTSEKVMSYLSEKAQRCIEEIEVHQNYFDEYTRKLHPYLYQVYLKEGYEFAKCGATSFDATSIQELKRCTRKIDSYDVMYRSK